MPSEPFIMWFEEISIKDVPLVGGKNASLGEMFRNLTPKGVKVPDGFAVTAAAYRHFIRENHLDDQIRQILEGLDTHDIKDLQRRGKKVRDLILKAEMPEDLASAIKEAYHRLEEKYYPNVDVAVRSSATAEDLPDASFAGQQETYLNIQGAENVIKHVKKCFASLFTDRAISYRQDKGFDHFNVYLSVAIQKMVRSDAASSGVMFTLDTESGFSDVVFITSAWGLGETVVQGAVNPDEFYVYKPNLAAGRPAILRRSLGSKAIRMVHASDTEEAVRTEPTPAEERDRFSLDDEQVEELARFGIAIEDHYGRPMDIEWALDGEDGQLYILQARPETVQSRQQAGVEEYILKSRGPLLCQGRAIGQRIGQGRARIIEHASEMGRVQPGDVLVTDMTDPDWEPIMKRAAAIVTNRGGRTCHAAIIAREMGIPAVVGCGDATEAISEGEEVTVSCAEGDEGFIYQGLLHFEVICTETENLPQLPLKIMMNIASPARAFNFAQIPNEGVGLARLEFIINNTIGVHPKALLEYDRQPGELQEAIGTRIAGYAGPREFYVQKLTEGIATLAAAFHPKPVIVRLSDFKSNEYANLLGGDRYEPGEENPMIGFRGASRYLSEDFRPCFDLECEALKQVRDHMGFTNVEIMVPFVRTLEEAEGIIGLLAENGLQRGRNGLRVIMMCEIPSNALLADDFLEYFDGFSIGSNDLTQLTLGLDRDSALVAHRFDERNPAVKKLLGTAIQAARRAGKYIGICGQGPSDYPDLASWLLEQGISSLSLNPDTVIHTWLHLGRLE